MDFTQILTFLTKLARNNNREWFEENKGVYLQAKENYESFVVAVLNELVKFNPELGGLNPKKLAFRIYRDVRFSKDKSPYKVNMGAGFSPNGKMEQEPGYYVHIQPGNKSFVAGGLYMPDPGNLSKVRQEIDYNSTGFLKILNDKKFKKYFKGLDDFDKLKTMPKGYPKDHPQIDLLKNKSFVVSHYFTDKEVKDKKFVKQMVEVCKAIKPMNEFLNQAMQ